jgi:hypothetical protein
MERRKAMAFATAITCVLGSTTEAFASVGGGSLLGFGGTRRAGIGSVSAAQLEADNAPGVVHRTKNVYDEVVVGSSEKPSTRSVALAAARTHVSKPATVLPATPVVTPSSAAGRHRHPTRKAASDTRRTSTRTASSPKEPAEPVQKPVQEPTTSTTSTTSPPVTTTTRPRGVPVDWPPNKPIPPMPPNCRQPQLEDNGVWNCQDD